MLRRRQTRSRRLKKRNQSGGTRYNDRPQTISSALYLANKDEEQYYYEPTYVKVSEAVANERKRAANPVVAQANPSYKGEINQEQYHALPPGEKHLWQFTRSVGNQPYGTRYYTRKKSGIFDSLLGRKVSQDNGEISHHTYYALPPDQQKLWKVSRTVGNQPYGTTYYTRKKPGIFDSLLGRTVSQDTA